MSKYEIVLALFNEEYQRRFWSKVTKLEASQCWPWTAGRFGRGYGMFKIGKYTCHSHRLAWLLANGSIPDGMLVCHACDNPCCCNPSHLFLGSFADNNLDCQNKGRVSRGVQHSKSVSPALRARGEKNGFSKLTDEAVRSIRQCGADGHSQVSIAEKHNCSQQTVSLVLRGERWTHVEH